MNLNHRYDYEPYPQELYNDKNPEDLAHQKKVKKLLEAQLERKRLKSEMDELDGEFSWEGFE